ncbi:EAL domain-containing protein [Telluria mixta]|uniref:EAL domain-containing protein n=1 Tax=Telluria mixta TaxID=34071 RepID=A0ABT2BTJ7_9BURK|nr:EAL domain-containing protein [Telluria mixta]MCS0628445.1 EAL domain-containing protein [Telluria mixta]WEM93449.1 EAL domain-containing protein [Telluria mixta]
MTTSVAPQDAGTPTVLIVDDTPANVGILVEYLEGRQVRVAVAQEGEEGLARAEFVQPDLILLDVMMPGMDGFETCRRLKASPRTRDIPVIFMTALSETHDKVAGFAAGGVDYVTKPFQIDEVWARVTTHLALRSAQKRLAEQNAQLRRTEAELQAANNLLEQRVAERTAELVRTNARLEQKIADYNQAERRIDYMAHHDALTGLPNRLLLEDRVNQAIAQARRHQDEMVAQLHVDLDHFKTINDSLGERIGDRLLQAVATRLQQCTREGDSLGCLGGNGFGICLAALRGSNDAALVAGKVLDALSRPFHVEDHELHVSASIGVGLFPSDGHDAAALLRAANAAMYQAKQKGRNTYQFFTPALHEAAKRRMAATSQLRQALAHDEFSVYYQPQVDMESGRIFSAEALLRWTPPGKTPRSCAEFIAIAEETGIIVPIGEWVLRQACAQLKRWRDGGHPDMRIAVNLSARQFTQANLTDFVAQVLRDTGVPADALELELTESLTMQPSDDNLDVMRRLSAMGVQLSIDDFGTGYSSLAYLQNFPIHALKIDRSFVIGINEQAHDAAIVTAIIAMAHSLHLNLIAEGVDSPEHVSFLTAHGCLAAQGYYYSQPVPAEVMTRLLDQENLTPNGGARVDAIAR